MLLYIVFTMQLMHCNTFNLAGFNSFISVSFLLSLYKYIARILNFITLYLILRLLPW